MLAPPPEADIQVQVAIMVGGNLCQTILTSERAFPWCISLTLITDRMNFSQTQAVTCPLIEEI
jgi:hypothetical protein